MPFRSYLFAISCALALSPNVAAAQEVGAFLGAQFPDNDYDAAIGTQYELGLSASLGPAKWPIMPVVFVAGSQGSEVATVWPPNEDYMDGKFEMTGIEAGLGAHKALGGGNARPYVEAGLEEVFLQVRSRTTDWTGPTSRDQTLGGWVGAGVSWPIDGGLRLGVSSRFSAVGADHLGGGIHLGLNLGWSGKR